MVIFLVANISDMIDGVWARRKNQITTLGLFLDPIADKLLMSSILICLVGQGVIPSWIVIIFIGRDIAVTGFRAIASTRGIQIPSFTLGKIKIWFLSITIGFFILGEAILGKYYLLSQIGLWLSLIITIISALEIFLRFGRIIFSEEG